jgi:hypothetical protein
MKNALIALFILFSPISVVAQKHFIYGDIGTATFSNFRPGFSITHNYRLIKHIGVGIGVQGYSYSPISVNRIKFTPAVFADIRFHIRPAKTNQFFAFLDVGANYHGMKGSYYTRDRTQLHTVKSNISTCTGIGIGYLRQINKRGSGIYASIKITMNVYTTSGYDFVAKRDIKYLNGDGTLPFSIGYKF